LLGGFEPAYRCLLFDPAAERKDEDAEKEAAAAEEDEEDEEEGRRGCMEAAVVCDEKWKCDESRWTLTASHTHTHIQQPNVTRRDSAAGVDR
jgi:hypothetical protein